jgi:mannose/fructose-specific phosphotransferase system component IIA
VSAERPVPALLVTHGALGEALVTTARGIVGELPGVTVLSNTGLSRAALVDAVRAHVLAMGEEGGIVLVDVLGGSCAQASLAAAGRGAPGPVPVVTGVNLPMLLDFVQNRTVLDPRALAARLASKGQAAVVVLGAHVRAGETPS